MVLCVRPCARAMRDAAAMALPCTSHARPVAQKGTARFRHRAHGTSALGHGWDAWEDARWDTVPATHREARERRSLIILIYTHTSDTTARLATCPGYATHHVRVIIGHRHRRPQGLRALTRETREAAAWWARHRSQTRACSLYRKILPRQRVATRQLWNLP